MKGQRGFTIIEMLVIIGIMTVLSGLLILYSRTGEMTSTLIREIAKISSNINRARNMAITTSDWNGQRVCGYGVFFNKAENKYIIFTDLSADCQSSLHLRPQDQSADVETIPVTAPLTISQTDIDQVFFLPPDPTVYFEPDVSNEVEIKIQTPSGTEMGVKLNKTGQVSAF